MDEKNNNDSVASLPLVPKTGNEVTGNGSQSPLFESSFEKLKLYDVCLAEKGNYPNPTLNDLTKSIDDLSIYKKCNNNSEIEKKSSSERCSV